MDPKLAEHHEKIDQLISKRKEQHEKLRKHTRLITATAACFTIGVLILGIFYSMLFLPTATEKVNQKLNSENTPGVSPTQNNSLNDTANWKTYSSNCDFKINYPPSWATKKFFIDDTPNSCAYITAPDYKQFQPHGREGFYIQITRVQKGSKLGEQTISSLNDYITFQNNATGSFLEVKNKKDKVFGNYIGKEYEPIGAELQTEFIFENGQYVYSVIWPSEYKEEYKSGYKGSFKNDLISVISSIIFE